MGRLRCQGIHLAPERTKLGDTGCFISVGSCSEDGALPWQQVRSASDEQSIDQEADACVDDRFYGGIVAEEVVLRLRQQFDRFDQVGFDARPVFHGHGLDVNVLQDVLDG